MTFLTSSKSSFLTNYISCLLVFISCFFLSSLLLAQASKKEYNECFPFEQQNKWGYIDTTGNIIIAPQYDLAGSFNKGFAKVIKGEELFMLKADGTTISFKENQDIDHLSGALWMVMKDGLWRIFHTHRNQYLSKAYHYIEVLDKNAYMVFDEKKYGVVDSTGKIVIPVEYNEIHQLKNNVYCGKKEGGIDLYFKEKKVFIPKGEKEACSIDGENLFCRTEERIYLFDEYGNQSFQKKWKYLHDLADYYHLFNEDSLKALYSVRQKKLLTTAAFDTFTKLSDQHIITVKNNKQGLIDTTGKFILDTLYQDIRYASTNLFKVKKEGKYGLFDWQGKELLAPKYKAMSDFVHHASMIINEENKWGAINKYGQVIVPCTYKKIVSSMTSLKCYKARDEVNVIVLDEKGQVKNESNYNNVKRIRFSGKKKSRGSANDFRGGGFGTMPTDIRACNYIWYFDSSLNAWGLKDVQTEEIIIPPTYSTITVDHTYGYTMVSTLPKKDRKISLYGLVSNETGKVILEPDNYREIFMEDLKHSNGYLLRVKMLSGKMNIYNPVKKGFLISGARYIGDFQNQLVRVCMGGEFSHTNDEDYAIGESFEIKKYIQNLTSVYIPKSKKYLSITGGEWTLVDIKTGKRYQEKKYNFISKIHQGNAIVKKNSRWGLVKGYNTLIEFKYNHIEPLDEEKLTYAAEFRRSKYGLLSAKGEYLTDIAYTSMKESTEQTLLAEYNNRRGYFDQEGSCIAKTQYVKIGEFHDGLAYAKLERGKYGYLNKKEEWVIPPAYYHCGNFNQGITWVQEKGNYKIINAQNETLYEAKNTKLYDGTDSLFIAYQKGKYGIINAEGKKILKLKYRNIAIDSLTKRIVAKKDNKLFLYNFQGEQLLEDGLHYIGKFKNGLAIVKQMYSYGCINTQGKVVIPIVYTKLDPFNEDSLAVVKIKNKYGIINNKGETVLETIYENIRLYSNATAIVTSEEGDRIWKLANGFSSPLFPKIRYVNELYCYSIENKILETINHYGKKIKTNVPVQLHKKINQSQYIARGNDGKWGVKKNMIWFVPPVFKQIEETTTGNYIVNQYTSYHLYSHDGALLSEHDYQNVSMAGKNIIKLERAEKIEYIKTNKEWVLKHKDDIDEETITSDK